MPATIPTDRRRAVLDAVLDLVDRHGLEQATIRQVADTAGVSIGTVQHYFATKDDLLEAAYREVIDRIRARLGALDAGGPPRALITSTLRELLPLDARRATEARLHLAFMGRASVAPELARVNAEIMAEVHHALAAALTRTDTVDGGDADPLATALLALVDGLAAHVLSTGGDRTAAAAGRALDAVLALVP